MQIENNRTYPLQETRINDNTPEPTTDKTQTFKKTWITLFMILTISLIAVSIYSNKTTYPEYKNSDEQSRITKEDLASIHYTISNDSGNILYTTIKEVAVQQNIFVENKSYTPELIDLGKGDIIPGLIDALLGMKAGEVKEVKILPENAFGAWNHSLTEAVPRIQKSKRLHTSNRETFLVEVGLAPYVGLKAKTKALGWPLEVISDNGENITYKYNPENGTTINTVFGKAEIATDEQSLYIILPEPALGAKIKTDAGLGKIIEINDSHIILDFNHELAGESLSYRIEVVAVYPGSDGGVSNGSPVTLKYFWSKYCGYCKKQDPILIEFLRDHPRLNFVLIDVNTLESKPQMIKYGAFGTPTFILQKGNVEVKVAGLQSREQLTSFICPKLVDEMCLTGESKIKRNVSRWW